MKDYDNFFLPIDDLEKGKDFYRKILGLSVKFDFSDKGMVTFKVGNQEPAIILKDLKKFPQAKTTIWFVVNDVIEEYKKLKGKGVQFLSEPFHISTGLAGDLKIPLEIDLELQIIQRKNSGIRATLRNPSGCSVLSHSLNTVFAVRPDGLTQICLTPNFSYPPNVI